MNTTLKHGTRRARRTTRRLVARGQSTVEYIIITSMSVLVLIEGGDSAPVKALIETFKGLYRGFTYGMSFATGINIF